MERLTGPFRTTDPDAAYDGRRCNLAEPQRRVQGKKQTARGNRPGRAEVTAYGHEGCLGGWEGLKLDGCDVDATNANN